MSLAMSKSRLISYLLLAGLVAAYPLVRGDIAEPLTFVAAWVAGLLLWTLIEYLTHRFLFHPWGRKKPVRLVPRVLATHGRHHSVPEEMEVGLLPVYQGVPILLVIGALAYLIIGGYASPLLSGFTVGYIGYMTLHYAIHRGPPPWPWLAPLWRHHLLHHTRYPGRCFGVTTTLWDRLFGTRVREGAAADVSR